MGSGSALPLGLIAGIAQGFIIVRFNLSSVGVTLGGLLVFVGVAFVLTESRSLPYENLRVALLLNERLAGVFSIRSIVAIVIFTVVAALFAWTRLGRDIIATGSDRRAALTAGVNVDGLIIGIFAFSGLCAAASGVLLSYSLASASPAGLADVIAPAAAGAILGGVSLGGGTGRRSDRGRRAHPCRAALRTQRSRRSTLRQRHHHGRCAACRGFPRWTLSGSSAHRGAPLGGAGSRPVTLIAGAMFCRGTATRPRNLVTQDRARRKFVAPHAQWF